MGCLYCVKRKGIEITYFNHAKPVKVLCSGATKMTDLIKQVGGIEKAKKIVACTPEWAIKFTRSSIGGDEFCIDDLRQAIADYNTDHCINIENHISPSTIIINK